jgi:hypothetical protein
MRLKDFSEDELKRLTPEQVLALMNYERSRLSEETITVLLIFLSLCTIFFGIILWITVFIVIGILLLAISLCIWWKNSMKDLI